MRLDGERQSEPVPHLIRYAVGANRIDIILEDGATSSVWWATKNEWLGLLDVAGLSLEGLLSWHWRAGYPSPQFLNHVLPTLANIKPGVQIAVEYPPESPSPQFLTEAGHADGLWK